MQGDLLDLKAELEALRAPAAAEAAEKETLRTRAEALRASLARLPEEIRQASMGPAANDAATARGRLELLAKREGEERGELAQLETALRDTPAADALARLSMQAVIYVHDNGRVQFTVEPPAPAGMFERLAADGKTYTLGRAALITSVYVDGEGLLRKRPESPARWEGAASVAAGGQASIALIAPIGAQVFIEGELAGEVDASGRFAIAAGEPGAYDVRVVAWPYLHADLQFTAE